MVVVLRLPCLLLLLLCLPLSSASSDAELLVSKVKPALQGSKVNAQLGTWNATSTPLCLWRGLRWSIPDGRPLRCGDATARNNLSLVRDPALLLVSIRLPAAGLAGTLPPELGAFSSLGSVYLGANQLSGAIPLELGNAPALSALDLSGNRLSGGLPASIWNLCDRATELRLHGNALSGPVPAPAGPNTTCDGLRVLDLGANRFSGAFPSFLAAFRGLQRLDLSSNNFSSGQVPEALSSRFPPDSLDGPWVRRHGHLSSRGVAGMVIGVMAAAVVLASVSIGWAQGRWGAGHSSSSRDEMLGDDADSDGHQQLVVFEGGEHLTLEEVLNATGQVVAKASYCTVYKAKLGTAGGCIELRLLRDGCCKPDAASRARRIGRARHRNLVPLRAFYHGRRGEKMLVYDHVPRARTLQDLLHSDGSMPTWARRHRVALGVARALAYLHAAQGEAHGNVRASSVVVDDDMLVARLAEHALHSLLLPAAAEALLAADAYRAPELRSMAKCSARTDVYAFGILLLELLMGHRKPSSDHLPSLVKAAVLEEAPLEDLLHAGPAEDHGLMLQALKLAMGCCAPVPAARPTMPEVVRQLQDARPTRTLHPSSAMYSPAESRSDAGTPTTIDDGRRTDC